MTNIIYWSIYIIIYKDTITGLLLAGIGHVDNENNKNFYVWNKNQQKSSLEEQFNYITQDRDDIAILLINQHVSWYHIDVYTCRLFTSTLDS